MVGFSQRDLKFVGHQQVVGVFSAIQIENDNFFNSKKIRASRHKTVRDVTVLDAGTMTKKKRSMQLRR